MADPATSAETPFHRFEANSGEAQGWKKSRQTRLFEHPYIQVEEVTYQTPNRPDPVRWTIARRKNAVVVAPRLADGRFLLIRQERYPVERLLWEFPAGQIDTEVTRESIIHTALNELREECGCALDGENATLEPLGWYFPSQGFTDEIVYLFTAKPVCVVSRPEPDGSEHISDVRFVSAGELRGMIAANAITNALSLALYARIAAQGLP